MTNITVGKSYFLWRSLKLCGHRLALNNKFYADKQYPVPIFINTGDAKKCIHIKKYTHILRYVIYVLLFEVELNYGSNVY